MHEPRPAPPRNHRTTQNDYTFYARASRYVNRDGCGPKLRKILSIALSEPNLVNYGSSQAGKSYEAGLKPEEYAATLDKAYGVAGCFSDREAVRSFLMKLKEADTGISIVISGLIDEVAKIAKEIGLKPHTAFLSLGVHGKRALLPGGRGPAGHDDVRPRHGRLQTHAGGDGPGEAGKDDPREGRPSSGPALPLRDLQHHPLPHHPRGVQGKVVRLKAEPPDFIGTAPLGKRDV